MAALDAPQPPRFADFYWPALKAIVNSGGSATVREPPFARLKRASQSQAILPKLNSAFRMERALGPKSITDLRGPGAI